MLSKKNNPEIYVIKDFIKLLHLFFLLDPVSTTAAESSRAFTITEPAQPAKPPVKHPNPSISKLSNGNTSEGICAGSAASCDPTDQLQAVYHSILDHCIRKFVTTNIERNSGKDCGSKYSFQPDTVLPQEL